MNKSNKTLTLGTSVFIFISTFMSISVANADVTSYGFAKSQICEAFLAAEDKKKDKESEEGKGEEEPDCE